ncbi:hypothetical protein V5799_019473 [Amblyomma americanum]|uniref:Uncharacterized protein n=1 Tax=Amblyomma americanum TaxID=6943 RepID=A0AAQ4EWU7_AMBAM
MLLSSLLRKICSPALPVTGPSHSAARLATVGILLLSPPLVSCEAKHDIADAFKIFENFPSAHLNGHQARNITYRIRPGPTPDATLFTINEHYDHELQGRFVYTDYVNCAINEFPFDNRQDCILWINTAAKDNAIQSCLDQFRDNCENGVDEYDEDSCGLPQYSKS